MNPTKLTFTSEQIDRAARSLAESFGYEWVFDLDDPEHGQSIDGSKRADYRDDLYDAPYWRHVAQKTLKAAAS